MPASPERRLKLGAAPTFELPDLSGLVDEVQSRGVLIYTAWPTVEAVMRVQCGKVRLNRHGEELR